MVKILKAIDKNESYDIDKGLLPNLSFRMILNARSGQGKTNFILNLLCRKELYKNNFDEIFLFSPSINNDYKLRVLCDECDIDESHIFKDYDEEELGVVLEHITEEYEEAIANNEKPKHTLIILDDLMSKLKSNGQNNNIQDAFIRGRHIGLSIIITTQFFTKVLPSCRANCNCLVAFSCSDKQLEAIADEHSYMDRKKFKKMFREATNNNNHDFFIVNYSNKPEERYLNKDFQVIDISKY